MAQIRPFAGVHFAKERDADFSRLIAPPYDVLDEADRKALQAAHPHNIVNIDLPHLPAKSAGPDEVYERANMTLQAWLKAGILKLRSASSPLSVRSKFQAWRCALFIAADSSLWFVFLPSATDTWCRTRKHTRVRLKIGSS